MAKYNNKMNKIKYNINFFCSFVITIYNLFLMNAYLYKITLHKIQEFDIVSKINFLVSSFVFLFLLNYIIIYIISHIKYLGKVFLFCHFIMSSLISYFLIFYNIAFDKYTMYYFITAKNKMEFQEYLNLHLLLYLCIFTFLPSIIVFKIKMKTFNKQIIKRSFKIIFTTIICYYIAIEFNLKKNKDGHFDLYEPYQMLFYNTVPFNYILSLGKIAQYNLESYQIIKIEPIERK